MITKEEVKQYARIGLSHMDFFNPICNRDIYDGAKIVLYFKDKEGIEEGVSSMRLTGKFEEPIELTDAEVTGMDLQAATRLFIEDDWDWITGMVNRTRDLNVGNVINYETASDYVQAGDRIIKRYGKKGFTFKRG